MQHPGIGMAVGLLSRVPKVVGIDEKGRGRMRADLVVICRANEGSLHRPPGWFANELNLTKGNSFTGALSIVVIQRCGRDLWTLISVEDRRIVSTNGRVRQTNCKMLRGSLLPTPPLSSPFRCWSSFRSFFATETRLFIPFSVEVHSFSYRRLFLPFTFAIRLCRTESDAVALSGLNWCGNRPDGHPVIRFARDRWGLSGFTRFSGAATVSSPLIDKFSNGSMDRHGIYREISALNVRARSYRTWIWARLW